MSAKNRTALKALITAWAATLDLEATHKPDEQDILDSVLLNRDVTNTIAASGATNVVFAGYDTIIVNASASSALTVSGLSDGEVKYLIVNKTAGYQITFTGATAMDFDSTYADGLTLLVYKMVSKGSAGVLAIPLHKSFDFTDIPDVTPGAWNEAACISPWVAISNRGMRAGVWYRKNGDYVDISISIYRTLAGSPSIGILPAGFRPTYVYVYNPVVFTASNQGDIRIDASGNIEFTNLTTYPTALCLSCSVPLS